jgi:hypothetical protein
MELVRMARHQQHRAGLQQRTGQKNPKTKRMISICISISVLLAFVNAQNGTTTSSTITPTAITGASDASSGTASASGSDAATTISSSDGSAMSETETTTWGTFAPTPGAGGGETNCDATLGDTAQKVRDCNDQATFCIQKVCARYNVNTDANPYSACPLDDECSQEEITILRLNDPSVTLEASKNGTLSKDCLARENELASACRCAEVWATCRSQHFCVDKELGDRDCGFGSCPTYSWKGFQFSAICSANRELVNILTVSVLIARLFL